LGARGAFALPYSIGDLLLIVSGRRRGKRIVGQDIIAKSTKLGINGRIKVISSTTTQVIPLPAALPLFLSGLIGLGLVARRRRSVKPRLAA
jgi:hypothetical protein